jgi:hypothetical protein
MTQCHPRNRRHQRQVPRCLSMLTDWISGEEMWLTEIAARLREVASRIELVAMHSDLDIPDELVPKVVMNGFMDDKIWGI